MCKKYRFCYKSLKILSGDFFERNEAELWLPINMAPRPLVMPPVSLSRGDKVPHIFIRKSHQRARKFLISRGKRLLQEYLSTADIKVPFDSVSAHPNKIMRRPI